MFTPYQHIQVRQTRGFGKILLIDDDLMLTERDEASYHEMLVHVPLNYKPDATDVLIVGGGDGGACREALRHPNVKRVVVVDVRNTDKDFFIENEKLCIQNENLCIKNVEFCIKNVEFLYFK